MIGGRALLVAALALGCGGKASPATAPGNAGGSGDAGAEDAAALDFFRAQIVACNAHAVEVGNVAPGEKFFGGGDDDPTVALKIVDRPAPGRRVVEDGDGARLLIDLAAHTISAPEGSDTPVAIRYQTCPPAVFVGPAND